MTKSESIIKKSILLLFLVCPAYIFNFGFLILSQRILGTVDFGIFYTGISIINILSGPAIILNLFYARRITEKLSLSGTDSAVAEFKRYVRNILTWGGLLALAGTTALWGGGIYIGVDSLILVLTICGTTYCIYLAETTRAAFQGLKKFLALGIQTLIWMVIRFILGILGLMAMGYVWTGITGVLLSALTIFFASYYYISRGSVKAVRGNTAEPLALRKMFYFCLSYGFYILLMYIDVITGYVAFSRSDLGIYSGACVIGKSMVLLTNPIVQVYFPMIVEQHVRTGIKRLTVIKSLGLTLAICFVILLVVAAMPDFIGTKILGTKEMDISLLIAVTTSGIPLAVLRIFILLQLSRGYNKHGFILLPACIIQFLLLIFYSHNIVQFAWLFTISSFAVTAFYGVMCKTGGKIKNFNQRAFSIR